jgi:hypothetical protein
MRVLLAFLGLVVFVPGSALGEEDVLNPNALSHKGQVGVSLGVGTGYRGILPYDDGEFCGDKNDMGANDDLCIGRSPFSLDIGLSYGISRKLELLLEMRVGLEADFGSSTTADDGPKVSRFAPGVKLYVRDVGVTKFYSTLQLVIGTTDYPTNSTKDFGIKQTNGLQFDLHKTVGVFFFFGEQTGWKRWLRFEMDAGLGIQARFP